MYCRPPVDATTFQSGQIRSSSRQADRKRHRSHICSTDMNGPSGLGCAATMISTLGLAFVLFATTNIDDIFVLIGFVADPRFQVRHVVVGQYLGIAALVAISVVASTISLVLASAYVGLLGFLPILIGLKKAFDLIRNGDDDEGTIKGGLGNVAAVAAVTIANGGDNIGIYTPVFATSSGTEISLIVAVFAVMVAVWLAVSHWLVFHPALGKPIRRFGHVVVPFVLIGLGVSVLYEGGSLSLLGIKRR